MSLTNLIGNKTRAFMLGAALTACGEEKPETKFIYVGGQEVEATCDNAADYRVGCSPFDGGWEDTYQTCMELNLENTAVGQEWFGCIYTANCDRDALKACDQKMDY